MVDESRLALFSVRTGTLHQLRIFLHRVPTKGDDELSGINFRNIKSFYGETLKIVETGIALKQNFLVKIV